MWIIESNMFERYLYSIYMYHWKGLGSLSGKREYETEETWMVFFFFRSWKKPTKQTQNESLKIRLFNQQHTILTVLDSFSFCLYCIHKSCWKCIYKCSYVFDSQSLFITVLGLSVCLFSMSLRYQGEKPRGIIIFWIIQWRSFRNALKRNQNPRAIPNSNISLVT